MPFYCIFLIFIFENVNGEICSVLIEHGPELAQGAVKNSLFTLSYFFSPGSGPDGRITKKDIDGFVPPKAAPVSAVEVFS